MNDAIYSFMQIYQNVLNPVYFLLPCAIILLYYDWRSAGGSITGRCTAVLLSWAVAYAVYHLYFVLFPTYPQWVEDIFAVIALMTAALITYAVWKWKKWGKEMIGAIISAVSVTVPYTIISPFWNISGHVAYTTAPAVYLSKIDKRMRFLFIVPLIMVINRPIVNAHTWSESIAGFMLGLLAYSGYYYYKHKKEEKNHVVHN